jgi:hypothetical protein
MERLLRIFAVYALIAAVIFVLQLIPQTGIFLMFVLGMLWIGVVVHAFIIHITILAISGGLPRLVLVIPCVFYAAGLAVGLSSDIFASKHWLQIDKQIPPDTHDLAFSSTINFIGRELRDQDASFQPEKLGFGVFTVRRGLQPDLRLTFESDGHRWCPGGQVLFDEGCFSTSPIEHPSSYLFIGESGAWGGGCPEHATLVTKKNYWATIFPQCQPIRLHVGGVEELVGYLFGALIRKRSYFLFPTAGCGLVDSSPGWPHCQWWVSPLWRDAKVGFYLDTNGSSRSAVAILMAALGQLRGQTTTP